MKLEENTKFNKKLRNHLVQYSSSTSIHGFKYLTEKRSKIEKTIWSLMLLTLLSGCMFMIYKVYHKYESCPVVVSFSTKDTPLYQIPFPAVTICPESKYSRKEFNYSKVYFEIMQDKEINETELKNFYYLTLLCDPDLDISQRANKTVDDQFFQVLDQVKLNVDSILHFCNFMGKYYSCDKLFTPILIDQGVCYSFNNLGREELFKKHVFHYSDYYHVPNNSHNVYDTEKGYDTNSGVDTHPKRALMSGADNSLTVFFNYDTADTDFICNSFLQGFRVLIHNPWDVPRLTKHYFRIPVSKVVVAAIEPEIVKTSIEVRKFPPEKRKCYMNNERPLKHFKNYTQPNCYLECLTNYTLKQCGCVQFFMPRDNRTAICGSGSGNCLIRAEENLKLKDLEFKILGQTFCDCKPSCTNLRFNMETSHSDFYYKEYFEAHLNMKIDDDGTHWSVLQIYFKDEQFITLERNELYGITDLIASFGGLLGLFTGFSLVSLAEIIYFCTVRIICNTRLYGRWSGPQ
ncbi:pickpocket protein 28-like [Tribolium madens]|uniref:pickpocket protein 28-like n=1 Tax=Tribolium madens TaxID=41895 RepID=UPI001CF73598|nr:pickpocket protein 28-like [Tribolium madens]